MCWVGKEGKKAKRAFGRYEMTDIQMYSLYWPKCG